ncbi:MAG: GNAT family N-acetyltransferase [Deltaproteobacteria bacterium]
MSKGIFRYRRMEANDGDHASALVASVFFDCIAPLYSAEGVESFKRYIRPAEFRKRLEHDHFALLAEKDGETIGLIEVKEHSRITLLFVSQAYQRQGLARELVHRAARLCRRRRPGLRELAVSASPNAVTAYEKMGFFIAGPELEIEGIRFVPMEAPLPEDPEMEIKAENPAGLLKDTAVLPLIEVYFELCHLKQLFRQGWRKRGVTRDRCESVADHCFAVSLLAMFLADEHFPTLDIAGVMRLALLHDIGEVYAGDITPDEGLSGREKQQLERHSAVKVLGKLPNGTAYLDLWNELQAGRTPEARFVREIDKLEMALQSNVYERFGLADLGEFYESAEGAIVSPVLRKILAGLRGK